MKIALLLFLLPWFSLAKKEKVESPFRWNLPEKFPLIPVVKDAVEKRLTEEFGLDELGTPMEVSVGKPQHSTVSKLAPDLVRLEVDLKLKIGSNKKFCELPMEGKGLEEGVGNAFALAISQLYWDDEDAEVFSACLVTFRKRAGKKAL